MYAPIMSFITEETYQEAYRAEEGEKSIHLSAWPEPHNASTTSDASDFHRAIAAIDEVRKYKVQHNMSLGKELDACILVVKIDHAKYGEFVRRVCRITTLDN